MTRLPNNPAPMLICKLCGNGLFIGNSHGCCYPCMAITGRKDIGEEEHLMWSLMYLLDGHHQKIAALKTKILTRCDTHKNELSVELQQMLDNVLAGRRPKDNAPARIPFVQPAPAPYVNGPAYDPLPGQKAPAPVVTPPTPPAEPVTNTLARIGHFLERPPGAIECRNCSGAGYHIEPIMEHPECKVECSVCTGKGWTWKYPHAPDTGFNTAIVHDDPEEMPTDIIRSGNESICEACGRKHIDHQLHRFGTGPMPLLLRRICDLPGYSVPRWRKL